MPVTRPVGTSPHSSDGAESVNADVTWHSPGHSPVFAPVQIFEAVRDVRRTVHIVVQPSDGRLGVAVDGILHASSTKSRESYRTIGTLPPLYPEWLGDRSFCETHDVRFPYIAGEMANGIASTTMVAEMARAEMLGFFGAAGLTPDSVERVLDEIAAALPGRRNWGVNLIHSPNEPELEERVADLLLRKQVPCISMSAYLDLTPVAVRCAVAGLRQDSAGRIVRRTRIFAKISRAETAEKFLSPAPAELLNELVRRGHLTQSEASLAARVPIADDVTVEADSGGHTDNRPLVAILPGILALRDEMVRRYRYAGGVRVGAAGGLGTPEGIAAAFALGAAYVVTGSVNQSAVEAGVSNDAKALLSEAGITDVTMAPAADMFEMGVRLQVLRRGTLFASRADRLHDVYRANSSIEAIPADVREKLEREVFGLPLDEVWRQTQEFWTARDRSQIDRAERDPRHRMALVFRWYLGQSSRWAIDGIPERRTDYQLWCGPAMGAFNRWVRGSFLADLSQRTVVQIARNLLEGAAVTTRLHQVRTFGVPVPTVGAAFVPRPLS